MPLSLTAARDDDDRRLDRVLRRALPELPLSALHRLLRQGKITVDGRPAAAARRVRAGEVIVVPGDAVAEPAGAPRASREPPGRWAAPPRRAGEAVVVPGLAPGVETLCAGEGLVLVNKPAGVPVHGPGGLEERVRAALAGRLPSSLSFRAGPLHRLDAPTSGVIAFGASLEGARRFSALLRERRLVKTYLAVLDDGSRDEGVIIEESEEVVWEDDLIREAVARRTGAGPGSGERRRARCRVRLLAAAGGRQLVAVTLETGLTHQIRAQAALRGQPLAGDRKYGGRPLPGRAAQGGDFLLHAWSLEFPPGVFPSLPRRVAAPLPERFRWWVERLFGGQSPQGWVWEAPGLPAGGLGGGAPQVRPRTPSPGSARPPSS